MKKLNTILMLVLFLSVITACKKDNSSEKQPALNSPEVASAPFNIEQIQFFRTQVQSGSYKTGEAISIEEAVADIEGPLNLEYGSASYAFETTYRDVFDMEVELNSEGKIDLTEAVAKYEEALDNIKAFFGTIAAQQKQLVGVDVNLTETLPQKVIFTVKSTVGTPPIGLFSFGTTDWWEWGFGYGKCGGYQDPIYIGRDAAGEIEKKILARKGVPGAGYVYVDFWHPTFDIMADEYLNLNDITPGDNIRDYLMYGNWDNLPNFNTCISNTDMNFYLYGTENVINQNKPTGQVLFDVHVVGDMTITNPAFYHHRMMPVYAILYYTGANPKSLD